ncbi:sugar kinase [Nocardioides currus]|uniref:Sugar kinase n=1 Tax=Nocardioides currus TaxID=2133958 RepID=A0A2R7YUA0_9ACTN|nr:sugar kinase [Nocardioides currus]
MGIDIGATKALGVALGGDGSVVAQVRFPTQAGPDGVLRTAARVVDELSGSVGPASMVGIGVPGMVDPDSGEVSHAVNLDIDGVPLALAARLAEVVGRRVVVENDVNVAALGVAALTGSTDLAYLGIGTGLAAGIVVDGRLRRGASGVAGEIGHVSVDPAGVLCGCGQRGCLETIASGSALARMWPGGESARVGRLRKAALDGDAHAATVWNQFADGLAQAVTAVALGVDPEVIVLGGGVVEAGDALLHAVEEALDRRASRSPFLATLHLADRLERVPSGPFAAVGAAMLGASRS